MYLSVLWDVLIVECLPELEWRAGESWRGEPGGVTYKSRESQACNVLLHDVVGAICMVVVYCSSNILQ